MLPDTDPIKKRCPHCSATMTHVRLFWRKIDYRMACHSCRRPNVRWS